MKKPTVSIELNGPTGNAFAIMGLTIRALKAAGRKADADRYAAESVQGNYENLLEVTRRYVRLVCIESDIDDPMGDWHGENK